MGCLFGQASGNVTLETVKNIGRTGVTYISRFLRFCTSSDICIAYLCVGSHHNSQ